MDTLILIGQITPEFSLPDLEGNLHNLDGYRGRIVMLNFWSAECPHAARSDHELVSYLQTWGKKVALLPIASNANEAPDLLRRVAGQHSLPPVLYDERQHVADLYAAVTTPHVFVIDAGGLLRYQGAFDNTSFRQHTPTRFYLKDAVEAVLAGQSPDPPKTLPYGCALVRFDL